MSRYYRYCVELTDGGNRIRVDARDPDNETIHEPGGTCGLSDIPERIAELSDKVRRGSAQPPEMNELGEALFEALFPPGMTTHFRDLLDRVGREAEAILRLELDLDEAELPAIAALPWEFLRAPQTPGRAVDNLGTHPKAVMSRRRSLWQAADPIALTEPLRIQLAVSAPNDLGTVAYEEIEAALQQLARDHPDQIAPPLEVIHQPSITELDRALEKHRPHILHFIGHGRLRKRARGGQFGELALVDPVGDAAWRNAEKFGELFQGYKPAVVFLQACESGAESSAQALVGVASQVVQRNVPVVIAMQYPVKNAVAVAFAEEFYRRLGDFDPVDVAVQKARRLLGQRFEGTCDFAAPVLFMRVKDGRLFVPPEQPAEAPEETPGEREEPSVPAQPFAEEFVAGLPHPLAAACARFNAATSDRDRFGALDCLLNNLVKYLTAIALSQYWRDNPDRDRLRAWLRTLSQARLRTSLTIFEEVCDHYAAAPTKPILYPILFEPYTGPVDDASAIAQAYGEVNRWQQGRRARAEDVTPRAFLARLLALRETKWESDPEEAEPALRDALLPALRRGLEQMLEVIRPLLRYPLHCVERLDRDGKDWVYTLIAFPGAAGEPCEAEPFREQGVKEPSYKLRCLYLCSPEGQPLLNLHPFLISHLFKLYFLEYAPDNGDIWYGHCASPERYHPPAFYRLLSDSWMKETEEAADRDDPVAHLEQANAELEKEESATRFGEMPLSVLLVHLSEEGRQTLEMALGEGLRLGHFWLGVEFLLMGLSKQDGRPLSNLIRELGGRRGDFRGVLRGMVGVATEDDWRRANVAELGARAFDRLQPADPETLAASFRRQKEHPPVVTPRMMQVLRDAAEMAGEGQIGHAHLLLAALKHPRSLSVNLLLGLAVQAGWKPTDVPAWVAQRAGLEPPDFGFPGQDGEADVMPGRPPVRQGRPDGDPPPPLQVRGVLASCGRDLTALAQRGELRPAVGESAHKAMVQMGLILQQTQANNPILLGDPGVGKTAIVEGFAYRLATDPRVIPELAGRRIVDLPPTALLAGTKYRGDLEERLQKLVGEVREAAGGAVVFVDEMHTILGGRAEGGLGAIADALKPALARGEFPCIGATTVGEYRRHIEADPALARRFTPVWIEEPTVEEAIEIVEQVAQEHLGPSHGVAYPQAVVKEAVRLSVRYLHDERLPGKAIKLLDQAGPRAVMGGSLSGRGEVDRDQSVGGEVTVELVREVVSERTGVPLTRLSQDERKRMLGLEEELRRRVQGQDEAVREVARVVKRARAGLADPRRPLGVFLFAGPTGVGKTELGLALAATLFDEEDAALRLDMSEYMEKHQVSRLIGSPPGYVGYEEEGQLTGRLRRRPYSVVLLDEVEKAHEDVQHLFLQLFDAGRLTDARGNLADGRNAIFIMTTNLGAKDALGFIGKRQPYREKLQAAIEEHFTPEFLNRVDRIIFFEPLGEDALLRIFDKLFARVAERFRAQQIQVEVAEAFKRYLCERYTDRERGARPLERGIEDEIVAPLTDKLLAGEIGPGMKVVVGRGAEWAVSDAPPPLDPTDVDARDELKAWNEENYPREFDALTARLRERGIEVEVDEAAREFLCDPFWTEMTLAQALAELVEEPLIKQLEAGELRAGDRVRVKKYADHLEFKKMEGDEP